MDQQQVEVRYVFDGSGGLSFIGAGADAGRGVVFVLSPQQLRVLYLLDREDGKASNDTLTAALYHLPEARADRRHTKQKMTASQRASFSRMMRRLKNQGYVISKGSNVNMTAEGADLLDWIKECTGPTWEAFKDCQSRMKEISKR